MSAREWFVSDPVDFMTTNIVRSQFLDGGIVYANSCGLVVTVKEMRGDPMILNQAGGKVYYLTDDVANCTQEEKISILFIGFKENATVSAMLDNSAQLAFTPSMDGCSLGVGSQAGDGACYVTHANKKAAGMSKNGNEPDQADAQHKQLKKLYGASDFWEITPGSYMNAAEKPDLKFKATNFGVNYDGMWVFYTHRWRERGTPGHGYYEHGGCGEATFCPG